MREWLAWALYGLGVLLLVATGLPLLRKEAWWIRVFDFPRLQIAALIGVALAGLLWVNQGGAASAFGNVFLALLTMALAYQCSACCRTRGSHACRCSPAASDRQTRASACVSNV